MFLVGFYLVVICLILYFNFKRHNIPINSNIINIVLYTTNLYDSEYIAGGTYIDAFREYCGKILAGLFNTNSKYVLDKNFEGNIFIN
jgi:hypothetical protein